MNELCNFLMTNWWMILLIIGYLRFSPPYGIVLLALLISIGYIHPIVLWCTIVTSLFFPYSRKIELTSNTQDFIKKLFGK